MPLINSIISWLNIKRHYQIELFRKYPFDVQKEVLHRLLARAKNTEWGKTYGYESIKTIEDYRERVPLQYYEDIKPMVDRLRQGEENLLWPGEIKWFARSSGTTNDKSKYIPVSKEALEECHFRGGKDIIAIHAQNYPETSIMQGKALALGGSRRINNFSNQSFYGDLSAILIQNLPFWVSFIKTPSDDIALLEEWEEKLEKIYHTTLHENVTNLAGVPSWTLVLLKYMLEKSGKKNILEIWPNLELFTHGGVSFIPYRKQFEMLIPSPDMKYMETYNASEGFFGIQDDLNDNSMLLMLDYGIFYEFIPMENLSDENPPAKHIGEVETGRNYAMVISTNSGLWRYIIGDTVVFTSLFPHKIKISGRTKHFINAFGEELMIDNAEKALHIACEKAAAMIKEYSACPIYMTNDTKGAHEWVIEFEKEPENLAYFSELLDHALMSLNSDYEAKRYKNITLDPPLVHSVKHGVFYEWFNKRGKLGGQNKVPRLSNSRKYVEELLDIHRKLA
ncbi:MAG TPA: GH3 auxin-responsive promoter family protein [Bacteroidetes bacterium]|nr:GH3 auxin-responsive promoter family protein [Bacteroidota bacterium]